MSSVVSTVSTSSNPVVLAQDQQPEPTESGFTVATAVIAVPGILFLLAILMALLVTVYSAYRRRQLRKTGIGDPEYGLLEDRNDDSEPQRTDEHQDASNQQNKPLDVKGQLLIPGKKFDTTVSYPDTTKRPSIYPNHRKVEQEDLSQIQSSPGGVGTAHGITKSADGINELPREDTAAQNNPVPISTPMRRHRGIVGPFRIGGKVKLEIRFKKNGQPFFYKRSASVAPFPMMGVIRHDGRIIYPNKQYYRQRHGSMAAYAYPIPLIVKRESWTKGSHITQIPFWKIQLMDDNKIPKIFSIKCLRGPSRKRRRRLKRKKFSYVPGKLEKISAQDAERDLSDYDLVASSSMITHAPSVTHTAAVWRIKKELANNEDEDLEDQQMELTWSDALKDSKGSSFQLYAERSAQLIAELGRNASYDGDRRIIQEMPKSQLPGIDANQEALSQLPDIGVHQTYTTVEIEEQKDLPRMYFSGLSMSTEEGEEEVYKLQLSDSSSKDTAVRSSEGKLKQLLKEGTSKHPIQIEGSKSQGKIDGTSFIVPQLSIVSSATATGSVGTAIVDMGVKSDGKFSDDGDLYEEGMAKVTGTSGAEGYPAISSNLPPATSKETGIGPLNITRISSLVKQMMTSTDSDSGRDSLKEREKAKWHSDKRQKRLSHDDADDYSSETLNIIAREEMKKKAKVGVENILSKLDSDKESSISSYTKDPKNIQGWDGAGMGSLHTKNMDSDSDYIIQGNSKSTLGGGNRSDLKLAEHSKESERLTWKKGSNLASTIKTKLHRRKTASNTSRGDISSSAADEMMQAGIHENDIGESDIVDIQSLGTSFEENNTPTEGTMSGLVSGDAGSGITVQAHPDSQRRSKKKRISNLNEDSDMAFPSVSTYLVNKDILEQTHGAFFSTEDDQHGPRKVGLTLKERTFKESGRVMSDMLSGEMGTSQQQKRVRMADDVEESDIISSIYSPVYNRVTPERGHGDLFSSPTALNTKIEGSQHTIPSLPTRSGTLKGSSTDRQSPDILSLNSEYLNKKISPKSEEKERRNRLTPVQISPESEEDKERRNRLTPVQTSPESEEDKERHNRLTLIPSMTPLKHARKLSDGSALSVLSTTSSFFRDRLLSSNTGRTSRASSLMKPVRLRTLDSGTDVGSKAGNATSRVQLSQREMGQTPSEYSLFKESASTKLFGDSFRNSMGDNVPSMGGEERPEEGELRSSEWKGHERGNNYGTKLVKQLSASPLMVIEDALKDDVVHRRDSELLQEESNIFFDKV